MSIEWPERFIPGKPPIHVKNEIDVAASAERVWEILIRAPLWPTWYANSRDVVVDRGLDVLSPGARFWWRTFGITIDSTVCEFAPPERLAWDAHGVGVEAYHAWLVLPTSTGCHVLTEETQYGWLARLGTLIEPKRMFAQHQRWLEGLVAQAAR